jgi:hypothetical protein
MGCGVMARPGQAAIETSNIQHPTSNGSLQNKGLVLIIVCSLLANLSVSFLHGLVPSVLVSITDGIAGIILLILAAIWEVTLALPNGWWAYDETLMVGCIETPKTARFISRERACHPFLTGSTAGWASIPLAA